MSNQFYAIDSLVDEQVNFLTQQKATLFKQATINGKTDTVTAVPSDTVWSDELTVFKQLNVINKPIYTDVYDVSRNTPDINSNLKVTTFKSTRPLQVDYLSIYFQETSSKIRKIEALYNEENSLYSSSRLLRMEFQNIQNKPVLTSYSITGGQKMVLGDSVEFSIKGNISFR